MNKRIYYFLVPVIAFSLFFCTGCFFFSDRKTDTAAQYQNYIPQNRYQSILASGKFICLIDQECPPGAQTIQNVIKIAENSALSVEFRNVPATLRIPALLRSGKGDLAIGSYTVKDSKEKHLDAIPVAGAICLLRQNDPEWKKILLSGADVLQSDVPADKK